MLDLSPLLPRICLAPALARAGAVGLREKLARLVGGRAQDIALMPNTTRGIVDVALCFPWERGDRVILFAGEFPANVTPWQRAAEVFGLEIVWLYADSFQYGGSGFELLERELARGVRLVAVSAVEFQTGFRMPVEAMAAMCHRAGAEIFVDAVQACGAVPIDAAAAGIDYLAAGAHKWLMGLEGAGFLYVSPDRIDALHPQRRRLASTTSGVGVAFLLQGPGRMRYDRPIKKRADLFEGGNVNTAGLAALEASVDLIQQIGVPAIFAHVNRIFDELEPRLRERGFGSVRSRNPDGRSCTLSFVTPGVDVVELHRRLGARGVACSIPDGHLRFTPHWPNDVGQVAEVLAAVDASLREMGR